MQVLINRLTDRVMGLRAVLQSRDNQLRAFSQEYIIQSFRKLGFELEECDEPQIIPTPLTTQPSPLPSDHPTVFVDEDYIDQYVINSKQLTDNEIRPDTHIKLKYAQSLTTYKSNSDILDAFNKCDLGYFGIDNNANDTHPQQQIIKYLDRVRQ